MISIVEAIMVEANLEVKGSKSAVFYDFAVIGIKVKMTKSRKLRHRVK